LQQDFENKLFKIYVILSRTNFPLNSMLYILFSFFFFVLSKSTAENKDPAPTMVWCSEGGYFNACCSIIVHVVIVEVEEEKANWFGSSTLSTMLKTQNKNLKRIRQEFGWNQATKIQ